MEKHLISDRGVPSFVEKYILQSELRCAVLTRKKGVPKNKIGTPYRLSLKFIPLCFVTVCSVSPYIIYIGVGWGVGSCGSFFLGFYLPCSVVVFGEEDVGVGRNGIYFGQVQSVGNRQTFFVEACSAYDEGFLRCRLCASGLSLSEV